jgi:aldehyde:ferredoxin oxidoreductase
MVFWESYLICQRYGIDARSVSNIIAWLMVLYERGIINKSDADGLCLEWGNPEAIIKLTKKISSREGIGDLMADGLPRAAEKIGKGSSDYLLLSKGSPSDMHIVPLKVAALASAVSPIGEDAQIQSFISNAAVEKYLQSKDEESFQAAIKKYKDRMQEELGSPDSVDPRIIKGKAAIVRQQEIFTNILDMTGVCSWLTGFTGLPVNVDLIAHLLSLGFGKDVSPDQLKEYAEKMHLLERSFLCKCGLNRSYDVLSKAYFGKVKPGGKEMPELNFTTEELEMMKDDYYLLSGWHLESGMPTRSALERYGLKDIADKLGIDL